MYDMEINFCSEIHGEMLQDRGEDCYFVSGSKKRCMMGVFDGCGGIGARRYARADYATGAYLASRTAALAVWEWGRENFMEKPYETEISAESLKENLKRKMRILDKKIGQEQTVLKGELNKKYPTTMAAAFLEGRTGTGWRCNFIWAGDSRGYLLDKDGLAQITEDDLADKMDAMENLSADSRLSNMISGNGEFQIHQKSIRGKEPAILFCATDGCFGYIPSPMEFEKEILQTLKDSNTILEWEKKLTQLFQEYASDDFSLTLAAIGYRSFSGMRQELDLRRRDVSRYCPAGQVADRKHLWQQYKDVYYRYR